jgi:recombinational DNA repair ATPase RecF
VRVIMNALKAFRTSTLLVGGNNSGKTRILQAIQFRVSVAPTAGLQGADIGMRTGCQLLSDSRT